MFSPPSSSVTAFERCGIGEIISGKFQLLNIDKRPGKVAARRNAAKKFLT